MKKPRSGLIITALLAEKETEDVMGDGVVVGVGSGKGTGTGTGTGVGSGGEAMMLITSQCLIPRIGLPKVVLLHATGPMMVLVT
jgi:hypothetical protein